MTSEHHRPPSSVHPSTPSEGRRRYVTINRRDSKKVDERDAALMLSDTLVFCVVGGLGGGNASVKVVLVTDSVVLRAASVLATHLLFMLCCCHKTKTTRKTLDRIPLEAPNPELYTKLLLSYP